MEELAYQNLAILLAANPTIMAAISASNPTLATVIQNLAQLATPTPPKAPAPTVQMPPPPQDVAPATPKPGVVRPSQAPAPTAPSSPVPVVILPTASTPGAVFSAPGPALSPTLGSLTSSSAPPTTVNSAPTSVPSPDISLAPFAQDGCAGETFFDNFQNGLGKWSFGGGGSLSDGNDAFASYQSPIQNATETTGPNGLNLSILPSQGTNGAAWTAGLMNTQNTFKQTYGYWEATVDVTPSMLQPGMSWAFWMLGYNWPPEIDTGEFYGAQMDSAMHSATTSNAAAYYNYSFPPGKHVFATDWEPDKITWFVDGKQTAQADTPADFHQPMYIVLGTAATKAGQFTQAPTPGASATLNVQDVRVFNSMASALACVPDVPAPQVAAITSLTGAQSLPIGVSP